ncbi:MAG: short-chain dehydrogenase [Verrucomicrobiales bacterium]|nr:short-chain dehydrogenase [Verrucomicrobiales bacterium]
MKKKSAPAKRKPTGQPSKTRQEIRPAQKQARQPGREADMDPRPIYIRPHYRGSGKLEGEVALITGGDSGIGRSVALHFAREGADVAIVYLDGRTEKTDAEETRRLVENEGRRCLLLPANLEKEKACAAVLRRTLKAFGKIDILINNAARQFPQEKLEDIRGADLRRTFDSNFFSCFILTQLTLPHLAKGSCIINTTSVTAYRGSSHLLDYSSTKGAIVAFTRSLAMQLAERGIRVNGVAPGPIWTPLIPATFPAEHVRDFGRDTPMQRAGEPCEVATSFVFLASEDGSYFTGQVLHPNGGDFICT